MRILGIDYGDVRIGLSISDPFGWTAQPLDSIKAGGRKKAVAQILQKIRECQADKVIVGYPINMNGTHGPAAAKVDAFIAELAARTEVPLVKWDERLSSVAAGRTLTEMGISGRGRKKVVDRMAAQYILQGYLEYIRRT